MQSLSNFSYFPTNWIELMASPYWLHQMQIIASASSFAKINHLMPFLQTNFQSSCVLASKCHNLSFLQPPRNFDLSLFDDDGSIIHSLLYFAMVSSNLHNVGCGRCFWKGGCDGECEGRARLKEKKRIYLVIKR